MPSESGITPAWPAMKCAWLCSDIAKLPQNGVTGNASRPPLLLKRRLGWGFALRIEQVVEHLVAFAYRFRGRRGLLGHPHDFVQRAQRFAQDAFVLADAS